MSWRTVLPIPLFIVTLLVPAARAADEEAGGPSPRRDLPRYLLGRIRAWSAVLEEYAVANYGGTTHEWVPEEARRRLTELQKLLESGGESARR